jgi:hypothetical protein
LRRELLEELSLELEEDVEFVWLLELSDEGELVWLLEELMDDELLTDELLTLLEELTELEEDVDIV